MSLPRTLAILTSATTIALGGCASGLSGVGGEGRYACKAPAGSQCTSVSGVYANSIHGPPPASVLPQPARNVAGSGMSATRTSAAAALPAPNGVALRSAPRILRLWLAPWEDTDGDLHEASVVHVLVDPGDWLIERIRPEHRHRLDVVHPPAVSAPPSAGTATSPAGTDESLRPAPAEPLPHPGAAGEP